MAPGRPECLRRTAPSVRGLSSQASPRCRRRGAAGAVGAGGFRLPSRLRQLRLSPGEEGLPAGNPGRSQRASPEFCAGGGETGALVAVCSPRRGDLGRRCWEL